MQNKMVRKGLVVGIIGILVLVCIPQNVSAEEPPIIPLNSRLRHPILYKLVIPRLIEGLNYSVALRYYSADFINEWHGFGYWDVEYPLIFLYSWLLYLNYYGRLLIWEHISDGLNWNWEIPW